MSKLVKLDQLAAWVLFASMLAYFVSGYGMTKGIISPSLAGKLHLSYLTYIVLIAFVIHTSFAIHLTFKRWQIWDGAGKWLLLVFYFIFIGSFIYVDRIYQPPKPQNNIDAISTTNDNSIIPTTAQTSQSNQTQTSAQKTFTIDELSKYDGQNGNPAYVAIDGAVYDLTTVFQNGSHFGHLAGRDLSNAFYSRHIKSQITKYPIVGVLK